MKIKIKSLGFLFFLSIFGCVVVAENLNLSKSDELEYIPGEVIVKYKNNVKNSARALSIFDLEGDFGNLEVMDKLESDLGNIVLLEIKDGKTVEDTIDLLNKNPNIEYAEPNYIRYFFTGNDSSDVMRNEQWGLDYIDWENAYSQYSGYLASLTGIVVGVIDNGVNYNHPDLYYSMWNPENGKCKMEVGDQIKDVDCVHGYDFFHSKSTPLPNFSSHGTHVAGIIAATINNGRGVAGVNPHSKIAALKVGNGRSLTMYAEAQAIDFAIKNGIKIINASYGAYGSGKIEFEALERYKDYGGLFITAAGNDNEKDIDNDDDYDVYPCMYDFDNIICVASIDRDGSLSDFSNYGKRSVDISAPGRSILSTTIGTLTIPTGIYDNDFDIDDGTWSGGEYFDWGDETYAYGFYGSIKSPNISLSGMENVFISFSVGCLSYGVDVNLKYSTGRQYNIVNVIPGVDTTSYYYNIPVDEDYCVDDFSFGLETDGDTYCVLDDLSIYQDVYYEDDAEVYGMQNGTSMSTPYVAGLASLIWMINPDLPYSEVKNLIMDNGMELPDLLEKTVSGKVINVKNTLESATKKDMQLITGLYSSWTGNIFWSALDGVDKYYFEVLSGDVVIKSGFVENAISTGTDLVGNFVWRVQGLDEIGNKSDFSTGYICLKPDLTYNDLRGLFLGYECSILEGDLDYIDNCSDSYEIVWEEGTGKIVLNKAGVLIREVYVRNFFGEESNHLDVYYTGFDSLPTMNSGYYDYLSTITSISQKNIGNVVSKLGVNDGACGADSITAVSVLCSQGQAVLDSNILFVSAPSNEKGKVECVITFVDDENNQIIGNVLYSFNTVQSQNNGGGGGGGGGSSSINKPIISGNSISGSLIDTGQMGKNDTGRFENMVIEKPVKLELFDDEVVDFDFSWYNDENPSDVLLNGYTVEFNNAYEFAYRAGITTVNSIEKANMNGNLTRIAMAKMLSNYAINILGKKPSKLDVPNFTDVTSKLNEDYGGAVSLSYQLGIMGQNMKDNRFRPSDVVTRAEFATALSRMLYGTEDGLGYYYSTHLNKLYKEGIINNVNPNLKELRGYVMIMLMRAAKR